MIKDVADQYLDKQIFYDDYIRHTPNYDTLSFGFAGVQFLNPHIILDQFCPSFITLKNSFSMYRINSITVSFTHVHNENFNSYTMPFYFGFNRRETSLLTFIASEIRGYHDSMYITKENVSSTFIFDESDQVIDLGGWVSFDNVDRKGIFCMYPPFYTTSGDTDYNSHAVQFVFDITFKGLIK